MVECSDRFRSHAASRVQRRPPAKSRRGPAEEEKEVRAGARGGNETTTREEADSRRGELHGGSGCGGGSDCGDWRVVCVIAQRWSVVRDRLLCAVLLAAQKRSSAQQTLSRLPSPMPPRGARRDSKAAAAAANATPAAAAAAAPAAAAASPAVKPEPPAGTSDSDSSQPDEDNAADSGNDAPMQTAAEATAALRMPAASPSLMQSASLILPTSSVMQQHKQAGLLQTNNTRESGTRGMIVCACRTEYHSGRRAQGSDRSGSLTSSAFEWLSVASALFSAASLFLLQAWAISAL